VRAHRHLVSLQHLVGGAANFQTRLFLLVRRVFHDHARLTRHFVHFFVERHAFLQILELNVSSNFGQDRERERIPRGQQLILRHAAAVFDENVSAVNDLVTRRFTAAIVDDDQRTVAVHRDAFALAALDRLQVEILDRAVLTRFVLGRLFETRRTTDVERTHRQLRARLANRLRRDNPDGFTDFNRTTSREVAPVALDAAAATRFAGQHRTNTHALHAGTLNLGSEILVDLLVSRDNHGTFNRVGDIFESGAANNTVA